MSRQETVMSPSSVLRFVAGLAAVAVVASACGSGESAPATTTTASPEVSTTMVGTTTTTAAPEVSTTTASTTTTTASTTTTTVLAGTVPGGTGDDAVPAWQRDAQQYRGQDGKKFTIDCPPNGTQDSIWGTETYTDDSSVCNAAVHVGLITYASGGEVEYQIAPGQGSYAGTLANGVTSQNYGSWSASFIFPAAPPGSGEFSVGPESWNRTSSEFQGQESKRFAISCSAEGEPGSLWGTNTYTSDSSICTAAVHVGLITIVNGGTVVIEIAPGRDAYQGGTANGVTSLEYGSWSSSFTFPEDQTPP